MPAPPRLPLHQFSPAFVISKADFFSDVHVWPERHTLDPANWLGNFSAAETPYAINLLNVFMYFNESMCDALLRYTVQSLSADITTPSTSLANAKSQWRKFLQSAIVTYVEGEHPSVTDSGRLFARKARQVLEIDEAQIMDPASAIAAASAGPGRSILLLDDFVGAGHQMRDTWSRSYSVSGGYGSLEMLSRDGTHVIYTPLVATSLGLGHLHAHCPGLDVRPCHTLDSRYSLTHPDSILWPDVLKASAGSFLYDVSKRAGVVDAHPDGWQGFAGLALAMAFSHGIPDATLPLFFWSEGGWHPLMRRT